MINEIVGKYKITRLIGEGGMASVYEAEHEMLGTKVAIKVLNPILSANVQIRERFKNEAKMMASFNHPNITKIIDFDDQPHQLSIVMEFLEGEDLNEKIKRNGPLSQDALKDIFTQTLSAFQYAHEKGVVHRDIKPSNIYVLPNGHVKILDFGIAKLFGQGNEMTQTGTQLGTPIYMSPEQVRADKSIDHRSDIYSLGVTMYFAITGKPPYNADTTSQFDIFNKIVFEPLPELPDVGNFDDFVKKACQKDREQRFQSCQAWFNAMNAYETFAAASSEKTILETPNNEKKVIESPGIDNTNFETVISSNSDKTVKIGDQIWMTENLNVDKFRNGDLIPEAKTAKEWINACENEQPAWCYYDNDSVNGTKYGKLYNCYAVNDPRGLAPKGWHIPTEREWTKLSSLLFQVDVGKKLKSTSGWTNGGNGNNESGFNGLPGGSRNRYGLFFGVGYTGHWWSYKGLDNTKSWNRDLSCYNDNIYSSDDFFQLALSVRCLRD